LAEKAPVIRWHAPEAVKAGLHALRTSALEPVNPDGSEIGKRAPHRRPSMVAPLRKGQYVIVVAVPTHHGCADRGRNPDRWCRPGCPARRIPRQVPDPA